jgi:hypothetical protein
VRADADQRGGAENAAGLADAQIVLTEVDAVGFAKRGDVRAIIDNEQSARGTGQTPHVAGFLQQSAIVDALLAKLNDLSAAGQGLRNRAGER